MGTNVFRYQIFCVCVFLSYSTSAGRSSSHPSESAIDKWIVLLETAIEVEQRAEAADRIAEFGPKASRAAIPAMIRSLETERSHKVLEKVLSILYELGPAAEPAKQAVANYLHRSAERETITCLYILRNIGALAKDTSEKIIDELKCRDRPQFIEFRRLAVMTLWEIAGDEDHVHECLTRLLEDPDGGVRARSASRLWEISSREDAKNKLLAILCDQLKDPNREVREIVLREVALRRIKSDLAMRAVLECANDNENSVRVEVFRSLRCIGVHSKRIMEISAASVRTDADWLVRSHAAELLGDFGTDGKEAIPILLRAFNDQNGFVRIEAAVSVSRIEFKLASKAIQAILSELQHSESAFCRSYAAKQLSRFEMEDILISNALLRAIFTDVDPDVRSASRSVLFRRVLNLILVRGPNMLIQFNPVWSKKCAP